MQELTSVERIGNILARKPVDRIGIFEHFWTDTRTAWLAKGQIKEGDSIAKQLGFDIRMFGPFNMVARLDVEREVVEETEETVLVRDGNGALLRWWKHKMGTPEHVDFQVTDRLGWEEHIKPFLTPDRARIDFEGYRRRRNRSKEQNRFFVCSGANVFELIHPVCGHQHMLMGAAMDPDWVKDMVDTYARLIVDLMDILFSEEGYPDGIWFYEDMGLKGRPFMSPSMYAEIFQPGHIETVGYCKRKNLPVIMHSCGYISPLLPAIIEAGIVCLQAIAGHPGMDLLKLYKDYGDHLSFMGGIDIRVLNTNDRDAIDRELSSKIPIVMSNYGYVLHTDHSIPHQVDYDSYKYFVERGLELGTYQ